MLVRVPPAWAIAEREATPEAVFLSRRSLLRRAAGAGLGAWLAPLASARRSGSAPAATSPLSAPRDPRFTLDRPLTDERAAATHNIFDEFSSRRDDVWRAALALRTSPWTLHVGGLVSAPTVLEVDLLAKRLGLEERLYRHRCVEAWAMAVPWIGFPLRKLVELARPLPKARFLRMLSASLPDAPGWRASRRVFPYYEALSLEEATHELAFLATGIYGHALPPQHGAPLRLVVPWKYGFKSLKSIVAFQFTENRPGTFWNDLSPGNYGWLSNVDPKETTPWPQDQEEMLGTGEKRATQPFNGYAEQVAALYP